MRTRMMTGMMRTRISMPPKCERCGNDVLVEYDGVKYCHYCDAPIT